MAEFVLAGERRIGNRTIVLSSLGVGFCVVVCVHDGTERVGGVAQIRLSDPGGAASRRRPWRSATTAIPALRAALEAAASNQRQITARLVVGARILPDAMPPDRLYRGERSVDAARSVLARQDSGIVAGDSVRPLRFHLDDGRPPITQKVSGHVAF